MGYTRVAFVAGLAIGFVAGTRAGREQYDRMVKYTKMAATSPQAKSAGNTISSKATDLSKSLASKAPKAAGDAAKMARDRAGKISMPRMPKSAAKLAKQDSGRSDATNPDAPPVANQRSVNGRKAATYND
jgi:hypothetical protein